MFQNKPTRDHFLKAARSDWEKNIIRAMCKLEILQDYQQNTERFFLLDRIKDQQDGRFRQLEDRLKAIEKSSGRLEKKTEKIEDTQDVS